MALKWTREHERGREEVLELLSRQTRPFDDMSAAAVKERKGLPFSEWCQTYLPHYFDVPFSPAHHRMIEAAGEPGMPTFIAAFRGFGKSVILSLARPMKRAIEGKCPYFIYGSEVQRLAAQAMDYLRLELEHNPRIRSDYGEITVKGSEEVWVATLPRPKEKGGQFKRRSCKFEAFGIGMSPRGRRFHQYRPVEFIGDDLENAELARNPQREKNLWDWMMDEVVPALEPEKFIFTVLGTMFGPGCMMVRAQEKAKEKDAQDRPLVKVFLQPATVNGHSVWPARFSDAALERIRRLIGLRNWLRNYDLSAEDPDKPFQAKWIGEYDEEKIDLGNLLRVMFLDPAISEAPTGCPRALICVGANKKTGKRYVLDAWIARGTALDMVDRLIEFNSRFNPYLIGIEQNGGFALIRPLLQMRLGGAYMPVRYIDHSQNKDVRIQVLGPQFEDGRWEFPMNPNAGVRTLIEQLLSYPDGFVDGPDALAGCDEMLPSSFNPRAGQLEYQSLERRTDFACV